LISIINKHVFTKHCTEINILSTTYERVIDRSNKTPLNEVLFDPQSGQEIIVDPPKITAHKGTKKAQKRKSA
jgi:hypothetical protein